MKYRNDSLPAVFVVAGLVALAGCTGMNGGETATQAAPVPPPPAEAAATSQQDKQKKRQPEDLPDRLFAPLDDTVNDINRDINRQIDSEFPPDKKRPTPDASD
jgi:hypothetical protein